MNINYIDTSTATQKLIELKDGIIETQEQKINLLKNLIPKNQKKFWELILNVDDFNKPNWENLSFVSKVLTYDFNDLPPTKSVLDFIHFVKIEASKYYEPPPRELLDFALNIKIIVNLSRNKEYSFTIDLNEWDYFINNADDYEDILDSDPVFNQLNRLKIALEEDVQRHFFKKRINLQEFFLFCQKIESKF